MVELNQQQQAMAVPIVEALVDGLRIKDEHLNKKAVLAMVLIGRDLTPALEEKAREKQTRPDHRERLLSAARWIEANGKQLGNEGRAVIDFLIDSLRLSNKKLNEKAADALCSLPPEVVDYIIPVAFVNRKKTGYCVRLLGVIERLGTIPDPTTYPTLILLSNCGNERVHEAVRRAMMSGHPQKRDVLGAWDRLGRRDADG